MFVRIWVKFASPKRTNLASPSVASSSRPVYNSHMSSIDEIKARIDILDLVNEAGVKLRRSGRNYLGFCPFHENKRTPAFVVWPESGTWRCFGECNEGGDIFKFLMKKEGIDFKEALQRLAERAGVTLERLQPERPEQREEHERLRTLLEDAMQFYRHHLFNTAAGKTALDYLLQKRKLTLPTIEAWGLGYAPPGYEGLLKHFTGRGYSEQDLLDAGLVSIIEDQGGSRRLLDRFRHRIMIPIRDEQGRLAGFGARIHPEDTRQDQAKFINTSETPLFSKGRLLYGLDRARKPIRSADQAVIVEGYLDVIALHQAGFENVISPMGTALTEDQLRLLKRFTRRIVLALDPDTAGQKAILRGLEAARASMDREQELRFDARGLLRHEARLQADLRVANLPDGLDPDEIVERNPDEWKQLIAEARPIVAHVLETLLHNRNADDPKVKTDIVQQMLPLIEDLPNPVERDAYRQMLARRLKVDERSLLTRTAPILPRARPGRTPPRQSQPAALPVRSPSESVESACLSLLLRRPDLLPRLDRRLQEASLAPLTTSDFGYTAYQLLLELLQKALEQDEAELTQFVQRHAAETLHETYAGLIAQPPPKGNDDRLLDELTRQILQLRRQALNDHLNQFRFLQEEAQQQGNTTLVAEYQKIVHDYTRLLNELDAARKKMSANRRE
ncbi:MAG: DNA primase [Anaerolineae bacterium]|nr:MAG: DNA primase [Anaerolineae bacterium]